jgi:hypothetical protein
MLRGALTRNEGVDDEGEEKDDEITDWPSRCGLRPRRLVAAALMSRVD